MAVMGRPTVCHQSPRTEVEEVARLDELFVVSLIVPRSSPPNSWSMASHTRLYETTVVDLSYVIRSIGLVTCG